MVAHTLGTDAFVMRGARAAVAEGLDHIEEQVAALEQAVAENPALAFDLARTLVESTCRTILKDRKQSYSRGDDAPKLFKAVTTLLPLAPAPAHLGSRGSKSLKQTVNGLHAALQGVCELRNEFGFASHGSDGARPRMETIQAMLAAQAADTIVAFLHASHRQDEAIQRSAPLRFDDHPRFNDHVDETQGGIEILGLSFRASEVLFRVDHQAYRDALASFDASDEDDAAPAPEGRQQSAEVIS